MFYDNDVMQCVLCGHTQFATADKCLLCGGELKMADEEISSALKSKYRKMHEKAQADKVQKSLDNLHCDKLNYSKNEKNKPKCPLCHSTNIRKISTTKRVVHGYAFGLFSNTARSQWECLDCSNKF